MRIAVTLVDDRWVPETDSASNSRFAHEMLLQNAAQAAAFRPLVNTTQSPEAHVAALNADPRRTLPDAAVLGMGEHGYTASIFADAPEWDFAITAPERFVAAHWGSAPHARVSWSMSALKQMCRLFLLIAGSAQAGRAACRRRCVTKNFISKLANDKGVGFDVY